MLTGFLAFLALQGSAKGADSVVVAGVRAVAQREPVEALGAAPGFVRVRDVVLLDIDGDGAPEGFVWVEPHIRQTATILAYTYDQQHGARRILEGLVAGLPQPISGHFVDDHTLGFGVDMGFPGGLDSSKFDLMIKNGIQNRMSVVRYSSFLHADGRTNFVSMVDLSNWRLPRGTQTCEDFEFSPVEALVAGRLSANGRQYLIALTAGAITIFRFKGIRANGMFAKESWIRGRPPGVLGLVVSENGVVGLQTRDGHVLPLTEPS